MTSEQATTAGRRPRSKMSMRQAMNLPSDGYSPVQRRRAAAVLEVLAGIRTPSDAASALTLSLGAYYKLEGRALRSLVEGCEPQERGPRPSPEREVARLRREADRLSAELQRYQALARAAQRVVGLSSPKEAPKAEPGTRRRRRQPTVRALKAAAVLRPAGDGPAAPAPQA